MKQVLQSLKTGVTEIANIPCPAVKHGQLLIRSSRTLVSVGTERMLVEFGKAGWIEKARLQPEKVRLVLDKIKTDHPAINLIYVASNHASHAEYAIRALENDKSVHIEKPHVVTMDQLTRLCQAMRKSKGKIVSVRFNRPRSRLGIEPRGALDVLG